MELPTNLDMSSNRRSWSCGLIMDPLLLVHRIARSCRRGLTEEYGDGLTTSSSARRHWSRSPHRDCGHGTLTPGFQSM